MPTREDNETSTPKSVYTTGYNEAEQTEAAKELKRLKTECWTVLLSHSKPEVLKDVLGDAFTNEPVDVLADKLREIDTDRKLFEKAYRAVATHQARAVASNETKQYLSKLERARNAYFEARNRFVLANIRLVYKFVNRLQGGDLPLDDLIAEGLIGLLVAVDRYDYRRGAKFSTVAISWIRCFVLRAFAKARVVRSPRGRFAFVSLDQPTTANGDQTIGDTLESSEESPIERLERQAESASLPGLLESLTPRERQIIEWRFLEGANLYRIGDLIGRTSERVRQVECEALKKLSAMANDKYVMPSNRFQSETLMREYAVVNAG